MVIFSSHLSSIMFGNIIHLVHCSKIVTLSYCLCWQQPEMLTDHFSFATPVLNSKAFVGCIFLMHQLDGHHLMSYTEHHRTNVFLDYDSVLLNSSYCKTFLIIC